MVLSINQREDKKKSKAVWRK